MAALRIQAVYRGRRARKKTIVRRCDAGLNSTPLGQRHSSPPGSSGRGGVGEMKPMAIHTEAGLAASIARSPSKGSKSSEFGEESYSVRKQQTVDFKLMRTQLKARASPVPLPIQNLRISLYILFEEPRSSYGAQALSIVLLVMIITSIVCFMIETMPELKHVPKDVWLVIEIVCTAAFTMEYATRLAVSGVVGISPMQFVKNTMNIFDLLAILPFYIWLAASNLSLAKALGVLRTVRLVRLFRIFKLGKYSVGLQLMAEALRNSSQALWVLSFFLCIGILLFSSAVYYVERMECPEAEELKAQSDSTNQDGTNSTEWDRYIGNCRVSKDGFDTVSGALCCDEYGSPLDFPSIVEAFWWSTVTMTTVGFGEVYPRTIMGRFVASGTMLSGILLIALPVAIIGRKFQEVYENKVYRDAMLEASAEMEGFDLTQDPSGISKETAKQSTTVAPPTVPEGPSLYEMSRRMRMMKHPDTTMSQIAMELADDLDEAGDLQKEIKSMQSGEMHRQADVVDLFDGVLKRFNELLDSDEKKQRRTHKGLSGFAKGLTGKSAKGLTGLMASVAGSSVAAVGEAQRDVPAPPLPPPREDPAPEVLKDLSPVPPGMVESPQASRK